MKHRNKTTSGRGEAGETLRAAFGNNPAARRGCHPLVADMATGEASGLPEALAGAMDVTLNRLDERYTLGEVLGEGRFSQVFSARRIEPDIEGEVALKVMELNVVTEDDEALEMLEAECVALRLASEHERLRHRVVRLHEVINPVIPSQAAALPVSPPRLRAPCCSPPEPPRVRLPQVFCTPRCVYLALDRVYGHELFNIIEEHGALPQPFVRAVMVQLFEALDALHAINIVHRDIKPENLIVSHFHMDGARTVSEPPRLTLIDFGYASTLAPDEMCEGLAGSPEYAAPEVLSWIEDTEGDGVPYGGAADIWSAGVTAHVMLCGELPFELPGGENVSEQDLVDAARKIRLEFGQAKWKEDGMAAASQLIRACMHPEMSSRPAASDALKLAWLCEAHPAKPPPTAVAPKGKSKVAGLSLPVATPTAAAPSDKRRGILPFSMPPLKLKDITKKESGAANLPVRDTGFSPRGIFSPRRQQGADRSKP